MARRDLVSVGFAARRHPAVLIRMDHSIPGTKKRPCWEGFPGWLSGGGIKDTGIWWHLSYRQRSRLHGVNVVGKVLGEEIGIDPGQTLLTHEQMLEDFQGRELGTGTEQGLPSSKINAEI